MAAQEANKKYMKWSRSGRGLNVEAELIGDEVTLDLQGEVDLYAQPVLRSAILAALELEPASLVVDMQDVVHLDSGGMAILITAAKKQMERKGRITLLSVNPHIYRTLRITGLVEFLNASPAEKDKAA